MAKIASETTATACTYDCPDACSLLVGADGAVAGDGAHPITQGFVCYRIHRQPRRLAHRERLLAPRLHDGAAGWREISWEQALALAAERLRQALAEHGPASVVLIRGGGSLGLSKELIAHFFASLGPTTWVRGGACGEAGEAAQLLDFGELACHDYSDLEHARAIVLWGKNPAATGPHLIPFLKAARDRGAPIVSINPLPVESERIAQHVLRPAPGGDGLLALAVIQRLRARGALDERALARVENREAFERLLARDGMDAASCAARAGVGEDEVELLARLYAERRPVATWIGWGLQRSSTGGRNVRCIDALVLLSGNLGVRGGGANFTSRRRRGLDLAALAAPSGRSIAAPCLGHDLAALAAPPARFVYVAAANPVTQLADSRAIERALRAAGFVVVADAFMTDTARAADLVLPVKLMLEEDDAVGSYQHHHVAPARRAREAPPGPRSDLAILRELAQRIGLAEDPLLADPAAALARMTAAWFAGELPRPRRNPTQPEVPFAERFATPSGRARLFAEPPAPPPELPGYPLLLMTPSSRRWQTSQLFEEEQRGRAPECRVHPEAPGAGGLRDGDRARLISPLGELEVVLRLDPRMRREACAVARGGSLAHGWGVNALVAARPTDLGEGTAYLDQRVRLETLR